MQSLTKTKGNHLIIKNFPSTKATNRISCKLKICRKISLTLTKILRTGLSQREKSIKMFAKWNYSLTSISTCWSQISKGQEKILVNLNMRMSLTMT